MREPVTALDGNTYDRVNIIQFWQQYGSSPIDGTSVADVEQAIALLYENTQVKYAISQMHFTQQQLDTGMMCMIYCLLLCSWCSLCHPLSVMRNYV